MSTGLAESLTTDLLRSAWISEKGRAQVYRGWSDEDGLWEASAERSEQRAAVVHAELDRRGRAPDHDLVAPHSGWIRSLAGDEPGEVAFADIFLARLGDWVDGHAGDFVGEGRSRLLELGDEEKAALQLPTELPAAPPFDPVPPLAAEPPGSVRFRFGILADLHIGSTTGEAMARAAIADLNASGAELVVQLGDITDHGDRDEFERATRVLATLQMPYVTMMGNHDVFSHKEERLSGREYYPASFGREPDGMILEHKGFRFAVLDSVENGASPFPPYDLVTGTFLEGVGGAIVRGALTEPQHEILAQVAAPGAPPAFLFLHHPTQPFTGFPPVLFGLRDEDSGRVHATVDSGNVWGVFAGHTHRNARTRDYDGVPVQEVAIPRDYPFGFALVDVTDRGYAYRFVQISDEELLRGAYAHTGVIQRRYARGHDEERAFVWEGPAA